ncbi:hypothetical protein A11A3_10057 [Alcanivorax hongdengensis A-11-3]|uniref:Uncharacterized protein n=1 Tax=Alcanivorax hongdengensis A-11-3 TaxID=1177179 RepID=L0WAW8_9GAMM|nr:hypothetical protein [Alcanivorax hongdengensis]EKF74154.1 hypothetical protein A11A3_10057 [Alcanivorax hongdengensis A-11-3]
MRHILSVAIILSLIIICALYFFSAPSPTINDNTLSEPAPTMMEKQSDDAPVSPEAVLEQEKAEQAERPSTAQ